MRHSDESSTVLLANLYSTDAPLKAALFYSLSDPSPEQLALFHSVWELTPPERKYAFLSRMIETSETNFELDFSEIGFALLSDADSTVRGLAISVLWASDDPKAMYEFIKLLEADSESNVRAAAASALGQFVLLGALGSIARNVASDAEEALLKFGLNDRNSLEVYRRSLESIAYADRREIKDLIQDAFNGDNGELRASAVFAMGRSADQHWEKLVLGSLSDPQPDVRFEAVKAAGEMGLVRAVGPLTRMARDKSDREIREQAIWALGEIGGAEAQETLLGLAQIEADDGMLELIEDAINMATLSLGEFGMYMMGPFDEEDKDLSGTSFDDEDGDPLVDNAE